MEAGLGLKAIKTSNLWPVLDGDDDFEWMADDGDPGHHHLAKALSMRISKPAPTLVKGRAKPG